jgi:hypothetical protein
MQKFASDFDSWTCRSSGHKRRPTADSARTHKYLPASLPPRPGISARRPPLVVLGYPRGSRNSLLLQALPLQARKSFSPLHRSSPPWELSREKPTDRAIGLRPERRSTHDPSPSALLISLRGPGRQGGFALTSDESDCGRARKCMAQLIQLHPAQEIG